MRLLASALAFALLYAVAMAASVAARCLLTGWVVDERLGEFLAVVALGALLAGFFSWLLAELVAGKRPPSARFAAIVGALVVSTAGFTAILFFLDHFFSAFARQNWPYPGRNFVYEFVTSSFPRLYLFAATGFRLYLPFGLIVAFASGLAFAMRRQSRPGLLDRARSRSPTETTDDSALFTARNGGDLVGRDQVPHLVRDRGAGAGGDGRDRGHAEGSGPDRS